jgi:hypothetical protein
MTLGRPHGRLGAAFFAVGLRPAGVSSLGAPLCPGDRAKPGAALRHPRSARPAGPAERVLRPEDRPGEGHQARWGSLMSTWFGPVSNHGSAEPKHHRRRVSGYFLSESAAQISLMVCSVLEPLGQASLWVLAQYQRGPPLFRAGVITRLPGISRWPLGSVSLIHFQA